LDMDGPRRMTESRSPATHRRRRHFPWEGLPENGDPAEDARWVASNYAWVVRHDGMGATYFDWKKAASACPSRTARGLMEWAASNWSSFYNNVWMKFSQLADGLEGEQERGERKSIGEMKAVLEGLREVKS